MFHTFIAFGSKQDQEKPYSHCFVQLNLTRLTLVHLYLILKELYIHVRYQSVFLRVSTNTAKNRAHGFLLPKKNLDLTFHAYQA